MLSPHMRQALKYLLFILCRFRWVDNNVCCVCFELSGQSCAFKVLYTYALPIVPRVHHNYSTDGRKRFRTRGVSYHRIRRRSNQLYLLSCAQCANTQISFELGFSSSASGHFDTAAHNTCNESNGVCTLCQPSGLFQSS
jgi:hypothetical protein